MAKTKRGFLAGIVIALSIVLAFSHVFGETGCTESYGNGSHAFSLATGSPGELASEGSRGLLRENDAALCWVKAGSGKSLDLLRGKRWRMIMVHAPAAEKKAVEEGWRRKASHRSNEFYIVGPPGDPAGIASATSAADAYKRIAAKKAKFFSRGDNSGTHKKEMAVWKKAGIEPAGGWYVVTKDFMTATLKRANDEKGYFMTDSSTWIAEKKNLPALTILFRGTSSS
jgi:tungstate transport system substrate-binding protein